MWRTFRTYGRISWNISYQSQLYKKPQITWLKEMYTYTQSITLTAVTSSPPLSCYEKLCLYLVIIRDYSQKSFHTNDKHTGVWNAGKTAPLFQPPIYKNVSQEYHISYLYYQFIRISTFFKKNPRTFKKCISVHFFHILLFLKDLSIVLNLLYVRCLKTILLLGCFPSGFLKLPGIIIFYICSYNAWIPMGGGHLQNISQFKFCNFCTCILTPPASMLVAELPLWFQSLFCH